MKVLHACLKRPNDHFPYTFIKVSKAKCDGLNLILLRQIDKIAWIICTRTSQPEGCIVTAKEDCNKTTKDVCNEIAKEVSKNR